MKKKILVVLFMILTFGTMACSSEKKPRQNQITDEKQEEKKNESKPEEEIQDAEGEKSGPVNVTIYTVDGDTGEIVTDSKELETLTEKGIWELLKEVGMMEEATEVLSLKKDGSRLVLDLNKAFGEQLRSYGTAGEQEILTCIVNTFLDAYKCDEIKITEEGETLLSGHAEYEDYFQKFQ